MSNTNEASIKISCASGVGKSRPCKGKITNSGNERARTSSIPTWEGWVKKNELTLTRKFTRLLRKDYRVQAVPGPIYLNLASLSGLTKTWIMLSLISYYATNGTVQSVVLAGFVLFVISRVTKFRRGLQVCFIKKVVVCGQFAQLFFDRMLAICQVCVFRFIRWPFLALPFQHQGGT